MARHHGPGAGVGVGARLAPVSGKEKAGEALSGRWSLGWGPLKEQQDQSHHSHLFSFHLPPQTLQRPLCGAWKTKSCGRSAEKAPHSSA